MIVRMWLAHVAENRLDDALLWVRRDLVPRALRSPGCLAAEILVGKAPDRILLSTRWDVAPQFEEGFPTDGSLQRARAAHYETVFRPAE
jgi:hypothetical protein